MQHAIRCAAAGLVLAALCGLITGATIRLIDKLRG
jgi:hypothetical protein